MERNMSMAETLKPGAGVILWNGEPVYYETIINKHVDVTIEARILGHGELLENTPELLAAIQLDLEKCPGSPINALVKVET